MSYAIIIGTTSAHWIDNNPTPPGCVRFDGEWHDDLFWDDAIGNVRRPNETEKLAALKAERLESIRAEAKIRIESVYPQWRQLDAALGLLPDAYVEQMRSDIAAVIQASNTAEDAVDAAITIEAVNAVEVIWP